MNISITELIIHPEKLADRTVLFDLQQLLAAYPYFQTLRLLYLKGLYLTHDPIFGEELRRAALYVADRKVLFNLIEGDFYALKPLPRTRKIHVVQGETDGAEVDRTLELIDAFLDRLPDTTEEDSSSVPKDDVSELSNDYTSYILRAEDLPSSEELQSGEAVEVIPMKGQHLIDDFIRNAGEKIAGDDIGEQCEHISPETEKLPSIDEDDGYFTETLAKIYIKQHRYSKALEIIRRLSLKYPKKNAYFADQIRFLEKLIINTNEK